MLIYWIKGRRCVLVVTTLQDAKKYGILSAEDLKILEDRIEVQKKKEILENHPYSIWEGEKNHYWYTYLPNNGSLKLIKRKDKEVLQEVIIQYWYDRKDNPTMSILCNQWLEKKQEKDNLKESSVKRYQNDCKRFIFDTDFGKKHVRTLTVDDLTEYVFETIKTYKLTAKAFSNLRTILSEMLKFAKRKKYTDISPTNFFRDLDIGKKCYAPRVKENELMVFFENEIVDIMEYIDEHPTIHNLAIKLCFQSGLRVGELTTLKPEDINYKNNWIHVQRTEITALDAHGHSIVKVNESPKTECSNRKIFVKASAIEIIKEIRELNPDGEYLFERAGKRIRGNAIRRALYRICDNLNIPRRSPHSIRRTYASILLTNGVDEAIVQAQMGHSDIKTTREHYQYDYRGYSAKQQQIEQAIPF